MDVMAACKYSAALKRLKKGAGFGHFLESKSRVGKGRVVSNATRPSTFEERDAGLGGFRSSTIWMFRSPEKPADLETPDTSSSYILGRHSLYLAGCDADQSTHPPNRKRAMGTKETHLPMSNGGERLSDSFLSSLFPNRKLLTLQAR